MGRDTLAGGVLAGRWLAIVAVTWLAAGCRTTPAARDWAELLEADLFRHPQSAAEDVYKFVHQSVYGPGHFIADRAAAARYLEEEMNALGQGEPGEPLTEALSDDPPLVRVNLRPFRARGGDPKALLDALVASASAVKGDARLMGERLEVAQGVLRRRGWLGVAADLSRLTAELAGRGYPAVHHSEAYLGAYRPAYRVVLLPLVAAKLPAGTPR